MKRFVCHRVSTAILMVILLAGLNMRVEAQSHYQFLLNGSALTGVTGQLAFDFIGSDNASPNNTVTIEAFTTDGTLDLGGNNNTLGAMGDLPDSLTLTDTEFFNESSRGMTFNTALSYDVKLTENYESPGLPDQYAFFLLDSSGQSLLTTTDPTGSDALYTLDINGKAGGQLTVYSSLTPNISWQVNTVPAPAALYVYGLGFCLLLGRRRLRQRMPRT